MKKIIIAMGFIAFITTTLAACSLFTVEEDISKETGITATDIEENAEDEAGDAEEEIGPEDSSVEDNDDADASQEEYFVSAILKGVDLDNNSILVEQLINDPDETVIKPEVMLSTEYDVVKSELNMEDSEEKYTDIRLEDIPLESEIGIMFGGGGKAQLIIYQVIAGIDEEELLGNTVLGFLDAVAADEEYDYFSSGTILIVGTEQEYINGDKSDIYFIIKESHSSWENVLVTMVQINGDIAEVDIKGDRMAEGTKYEGDMVTFKLVKEQNVWKIDFPP